MKRYFIWAWIILAVIVMVGTVLLVFQMSHIVIGDSRYPWNLDTLTFSSLPLSDAQQLTQFPNLKRLDLQQADLTVAQYDELSALLPDCEILWLVPFQGERLSPDIQTLTISSFTGDDIPALQHLANLKTIIVMDFDGNTQIEMLKNALPNCDIQQKYTIGRTIVDENTTFYRGTNPEDITKLLSLLPQISLVDARGCPDHAILAQLQTQHPNCKIWYDVPIGDTLWREHSTEITVDSGNLQALSDALASLPLVKTVKIDQPVTDLELMLQLKQTYPQIQFDYCFDFFGKTVTPKLETLNISGIKLKNVAEIDRYLAHFDNLKRAEMRRCGISNEDMDSLKQKYPNTFFIWEVQIGRAWIRTDVKYFMPYQHRLVLYDEHVDNLKYLTELICLDMGHMKVTRTDYLAYMPKLQYLLMCSTPITDISHCANMKDLKYLELFLTKVTDFSPLLECKNLVDLNICYTKPSDPLIFGQMKQLENLWFRNMMDWSIRSQLRQALPNTTIVFDPGSSTGGGWRKLPNYYAQRDILHMPYMEED